MSMQRPLFIPVILGTVRQGRVSEHVARFVVEEIRKREGVETEVIDIRKIARSVTYAEESIKDA